MKNRKIKVQKIICILFVMFFTSAHTLNIQAEEAYKPNETLETTGDKKTFYRDDGSWYGDSIAKYKLELQSYNSVKNEARYKITSYYKMLGTIRLYGDSLYVNGNHVGDFNSGNQVYTGMGINGEFEEVHRTETYYATLHSGINIFETTNIAGVGGESYEEIRIRQFATAPEVRGTNGIWYEGEVASGLRTWQSLYTDGKAGSEEGNKAQTSTGFMYYDKDEAPSGVHAYSSNPVGNNSRILKIVDQSGRAYDSTNWQVMNNPGTYTIYSQTKDSGGLESNVGTRVVTVKDRKYNLTYDGNGATSGGTAGQTCTILHDCTLNNNGFSRAFNVSFNGNGGTPSKGNEVANATFLGWQDHNNFSYNGKVYPSYVFNFPYYANTPGDIRNAFGYNKEAGISHWLSTSVDNSYENRQSSPEFSIAHYMAYGGADLNAAFGNNRPAFVNHFIHNGYYEGRNSAPAVTGNLNDTYPNRAVVKNLSLDDGATLTLRAKWKDGQVTLPDGSRPGYKIIGWYTSSSGGSKIGDVGDTYTPGTNTTIYAHWDKAPEITASDKVFYEGEYTYDEWTQIVRMQDVTAKDLEDGDITSKIKIAYDNVNVNVPGEYKVTYQVTDSVGQTVYKDIKVTVLYNNPPVLNAEDRWFYVSEDVNTERLMERVTANDIEDGDIKHKVQIISNTVVNHEIGEYEVTYKVTDAYGKSDQKKVKITIVGDNPTDIDGEDATIKYIRHISKEYIDTLHPNSVWRTNPALHEILHSSLSKSGAEQANDIWEFNYQEIQQIKDLNDEDGLGEEANKHFLEVFGGNKVK